MHSMAFYKTHSLRCAAIAAALIAAAVFVSGCQSESPVPTPSTATLPAETAISTETPTAELAEAPTEPPTEPPTEAPTEPPYMALLEKYQDIPSMTIEEYLENYLSYLGTDNPIMITGRISSFYSVTTEEIDYTAHFIYLAAADDLTNDGEADSRARTDAHHQNAPLRTLRINMDEGENFLSADAKVGDQVCWIGTLHPLWIPAASYLAILESTELVFPLD